MKISAKAKVQHSCKITCYMVAFCFLTFYCNPYSLLKSKLFCQHTYVYRYVYVYTYMYMYVLIYNNTAARGLTDIYTWLPRAHSAWGRVRSVKSRAKLCYNFYVTLCLGLPGKKSKAPLVEWRPLWIASLDTLRLGISQDSINT